MGWRRQSPLQPHFTDGKPNAFGGKVSRTLLAKIIEDSFLGLLTGQKCMLKSSKPGLPQVA
jgi:hypothetical protein